MLEKEKDVGKEYIKNIWFYTILSVLIFASLGASFFKYDVTKDYQVTSQTPCDINTEKCFPWL